jgi:hypothetical protein
MGTITRTPIIDDSGTGMDGTILNNAWKQEFYDQIDVLGGSELATITATGTINDYVLPNKQHVFVIVQSAADVTLTGIAGGYDGRTVLFYVDGTGAGKLLLPHASGASAGANVLLNLATSAPTPVWVRGFATYTYMGGAWRMHAHDQGTWITPPFNAANFDADVGTWTVEAGDVAFMKYHLRGNQLSIHFNVTGSTVSGSPSQLRIWNGQWGGFVTNGGANPICSAIDNGSRSPGIGLVYISSSHYFITKLDATNWAASVNNTYISGVFTMEAG